VSANLHLNLISLQPQALVAQSPMRSCSPPLTSWSSLFIPFPTLPDPRISDRVAFTGVLRHTEQSAHSSRHFFLLFPYDRFLSFEASLPFAQRPELFFTKMGLRPSRQDFPFFFNNPSLLLVPNFPRGGPIATSADSKAPLLLCFFSSRDISPRNVICLVCFDWIAQ